MEVEWHRVRLATDPDPESPLEPTVKRFQRFLEKRWKCDCYVVADSGVWQEYAGLLNEWAAAGGSWRSALRRAERQAREKKDIRPGWWAKAE